MEVSTEQLLQIIGAKAVEIALLQAEVAMLLAALAEAQKPPEKPT